MIIIKLIGGLGNQLFQYAIGKALAEKFECKFKLDVTGYDDQADLTPRNYELSVFNIIEDFATAEEINDLKYIKSRLPGFLRKSFNIPKYSISPNYIEEKFYHFNFKILDLTAPVYLDGYWQSEKYFKNIRKILLNEFSLKSSLNSKNQKNLNLIKATNSVSLHVRRGDYVNNPGINKAHGLCSLEYYKKAIDSISGSIKNPHFFLFSDDIEWTRENIKIDYDTTIVDYNDSNSGYYDLELMKNCKHNIIANSSFSWWGAWLNQNQHKIVIAPQKWFNAADRNTKDLIPTGWKKI